MLDPAQLEDAREAPQKLFQTIGDFALPGGFVFSPTYLQAGAIVLCIFLLILTFGMLQHRYNHWTVKGVMPGVAFGFTLALLIEAVLVIGGRTLFTEIIGWKNAPKPISNALDASRSHLVKVLGTNTTVPESQASAPESTEKILQSYENSKDDDKKSLQEAICR